MVGGVVKVRTASKPSLEWGLDQKASGAELCQIHEVKMLSSWAQASCGPWAALPHQPVCDRFCNGLAAQ